MMRLTKDASLINEIINHPAVRPYIGGEPKDAFLDSSEIINRPNAVALFGEHGGCVFVPSSLISSLYEAHVAVLPSGRGQWAKKAIAEALSWMFEHTDAQKIVGDIPDNNLPVLTMARCLKFEHVGRKGTFRRFEMSKSRWRSVCR